MFMQLKIYVHVTESIKNSSSHSVASESLMRVSQSRNLRAVCTHHQSSNDLCAFSWNWGLAYRSCWDRMSPTRFWCAHV